jgi:hypothetical protein
MRWLTAGYWRFQGFWIVMTGVVVFGIAELRLGRVTPSVALAVIALVAVLLWSIWARLWGRYRNRDPWDGND